MLATCTAANGVVVRPGGGENDPLQGASLYVGAWNGASAVAVDKRWIVTAAHTGGTVGSTTFVMSGQTYNAVEMIRHPTADLRLVRLDADLPGWHEFGGALRLEQQVVLAGVGRVYAGGDTGSPDDVLQWSAHRELSFGLSLVNDIRASSVRFVFGEATENGKPLKNEASWAAGDSGGGVFVLENSADEPTLRLAAIGTSVFGPVLNATAAGTLSASVAVEPFSAWFSQILRPGKVPLRSSRGLPLTNLYVIPEEEPPLVMGPVPPIPSPGGIGLAVLGAVVLAARKRQRSADESASG